MVSEPGSQDLPTLRAGERRDAAALAALVRRCLLEYGLPPDPGGVDADLLDVDAHYAANGGWFDVLEYEGEIVGCGGMHVMAPGVLELRKMYFEPALRGRGLGAALLHRFLLRARREGWQEVRLETASVLREAIRLYERFGFVREPGDPAVSRCDVIMHRELSGDWPQPRVRFPE